MEVALGRRTMNTMSRKIVFKILCWLFLEVAFNLIGIDDLVDYSEFVSVPKAVVQINCLFITV